MSSSPHSILVIKPSSLGDVVHTLPAVAMLRQRWPAARLGWLVNPEWAPLLEGNSDIDEVILFPRGEFRGLRGLTRVPAWARSMAARKSDLVVDFQGLLRSALIARLCRGGEVVGLSDAREGARFFYDRVASVRGIAHAVDRYLQLAEAAGAERTAALAWPLPAGTPPVGVDLPASFILLHPFSRGAGKSLTTAQVAEVCAALALRTVVIAGRTSEALPPLANGIDLLNRTTLGELIWLIRRAEAVISVDSGPMHIASALTPRLLSIHTWSDPAKVGPHNPTAFIWNGRGFFATRDIPRSDSHRPCASVADACRLFLAEIAK